jgi:transposase
MARGSKFSRIDKRTRARIVGLHESGWNNAEIARHLDVHQHTVARVLKHFAECGSLEDEHHPGRPIKQTRQLMRAVEKALRGKRGTSVRKVAANLSARGHSVSRMTVARAAHAQKLRPYARPHKPRLTETFKARRRRFERLERNRNWNSVVAADEATFYLYDTPNRTHDVVWGKRGDPIPSVATGKSTVKFNAYGAVCAAGKVVLVLFEDNLNAAGYIKILGSKLLPAARAAFPGQHWCYLHDRSPQHTSKVAERWLDNHLPEHMTEHWPPNSPDLNVMEQVWSLLRDKVYTRAPTTKQELRDALRHGWRAIANTTVAALFASMPARLRAVRQSKGGNTRY